MTRVWALLPAAGKGTRLGSDIPKQYLPLGGRAIVEHALECLFAHPLITRAVVVLGAQDTHYKLLPMASDQRIDTCTGGAERRDSVLCGLQHLYTLGAGEQDLVVVHDAARPLLALADLQRVLACALSHEHGALLAVACRDTLKRADSSGAVETTLERRQLWLAQTPQCFRIGQLTHALAAHTSVTDESSAMELMGYKPILVKGSFRNFKITQAEDLAIAEALIVPQQSAGETL